MTRTAGQGLLTLSAMIIFGGFDFSDAFLGRTILTSRRNTAYSTPRASSRNVSTKVRFVENLSQGDGSISKFKKGKTRTSGALKSSHFSGRRRVAPVLFYSDEDLEDLVDPPTGRNLLTKDPELLKQCPQEFRSATKLGPDLTHVETSLLPSNPEKSDHAVYVFPLVIKPKLYTSHFCLKAFLSHNKEWVDEQILKYGAVLFRGFDITSAAEVEAGIRAVEPNLNNEYRGTSPRITQPGSDYVFSAAEVPSHFPIAQHLEMSFLPTPPRRLFFSALQAPAGKVGGATALTDFRRVYRDVPIKLRDKLAKLKLRYTRTHHKRGSSKWFTNDISSLASWSDVFGTTNKTLVEEMAKADGMPVEWKGRNSDIFVSSYVSEPFQRHPVTSQPVWFNHAQVFHWTTFPAELWMAFRRSKDLRFLFRSMGNWIMSFITYVVLQKRMALDVSYGDGSRISSREMHQIRRAIHSNMVFNQWQKGDLLMIDNFSTSHGREPTYAKGRKIVVAWSDPLRKSNDFIYNPEPEEVSEISIGHEIPAVIAN